MVESLLVIKDVVDNEVASVLPANADKTEEQARRAAESLATIRRAGRWRCGLRSATGAAGRTRRASRTTQPNMDLADAARDCRSAVDKLLDLHGASGFAVSNPLQRYWRDIAVGSRTPTQPVPRP
jgi:alkylation response protein AidB-like acyl-CoA dehydrogenase